VEFGAAEGVDVERVLRKVIVNAVCFDINSFSTVLRDFVLFLNIDFLVCFYNLVL